MTRGPREDPERRAAFRAFVRIHHPDVGGDPEQFRKGLAEFGRAPVEQDVTSRLDRSGRHEDSERFDRPVTFVAKPSGVVALISRFARWWRRRHRRRVL